MTMSGSNLDRWLHKVPGRKKAISTAEWVKRMKRVEEESNRLSMDIQFWDGQIFVFCRRKSLEDQKA